MHKSVTRSRYFKYEIVSLEWILLITDLNCSYKLSFLSQKCDNAGFCVKKEMKVRNFLFIDLWC